MDHAHEVRGMRHSFRVKLQRSAGWRRGKDSFLDSGLEVGPDVIEVPGAVSAQSGGRSSSTSFVIEKLAPSTASTPLPWAPRQWVWRCPSKLAGPIATVGLALSGLQAERGQTLWQGPAELEAPL